MGIVRLVPINVFNQQNCNKLGVKLHFFSVGENSIFQQSGVQILCYLNILRFDIEILKTYDMKLIKFQNVYTWWDWALFCSYHLTRVRKWVKFDKSLDDEKTSFSSKRCANSSQLHCNAFRCRANSNMKMKYNAMLNSTDTTRLSTLLMFLHSYRSNTIENWRFRGPIKTSDLVKTPRTLLALHNISFSCLN